MTQLTLTVSDSVARQAEEAGLLTSDTIERLLREELRRRAVDRLFEAADSLAASTTSPLTADEIDAEIQATRSQKR